MRSTTKHGRCASTAVATCRHRRRRRVERGRCEQRCVHHCREADERIPEVSIAVHPRRTCSRRRRGRDPDRLVRRGHRPTVGLPGTSTVEEAAATRIRDVTNDGHRHGPEPDHHPEKDRRSSDDQSRLSHSRGRSHVRPSVPGSQDRPQLEVARPAPIMVPYRHKRNPRSASKRTRSVTNGAGCQPVRRRGSREVNWDTKLDRPSHRPRPDLRRTRSATGPNPRLVPLRNLPGTRFAVLRRCASGRRNHPLERSPLAAVGPVSTATVICGGEVLDGFMLLRHRPARGSRSTACAVTSSGVCASSALGRAPRVGPQPCHAR